MPQVQGFVRYMVKNGLVFEINRKVLHPLGLALVVDVHPENSRWLAIVGLDQVELDDVEGFLYDEETFREGQKVHQRFVSRPDIQNILRYRKKQFGYVEQVMDVNQEIVDNCISLYKDYLNAVDPQKKTENRRKMLNQFIELNSLERTECEKVLDILDREYHPETD